MESRPAQACPGPVPGFYEFADIAANKRRGKRAPPISPLALEAVRRIDALFDIERGIVGKAAGHPRDR